MITHIDTEDFSFFCRFKKKKVQWTVNFMVEISHFAQPDTQDKKSIKSA